MRHENIVYISDSAASILWRILSAKLPTQGPTAYQGSRQIHGVKGRASLPLKYRLWKACFEVADRAPDSSLGIQTDARLLRSL